MTRGATATGGDWAVCCAARSENEILSTVAEARDAGAEAIAQTTDVTGHRGLPERSAYACSKAGVLMLTRVLGQELQSSDISVNELIPGPVALVWSPLHAGD